MEIPERIVEDKVVVVTGAGGGIGSEIAKMMAQQGARVVVNDVGSSVHGEGQSAGPGQKTVDAIRSAGAEAVLSTDSVADWNGAQHIVQCALDSFGRIDAVVNNAGILRDVMFHKMTRQDWDLSIAVVLTGSAYVSLAAAPHFRKQNSGAYVHLSSTSGLIGNLGQANYAAGKLGLVGLSKGIAIDMAAFRVRSNVVAPTAFTRMTESIPAKTPEQQQRAAQRETIPPEKNAPLIVFLCSDLAQDISGQVFYSRKNEIILFNQLRPIQRAHLSTGWTPQLIAQHMVPAFRKSFVPVDMTRDVFSGYLP
jgi:NAD(P)-dependent dehydrogenase (short-subunit alcohol dehydrogenase family)